MGSKNSKAFNLVAETCLLQNLNPWGDTLGEYQSHELQMLENLLPVMMSTANHVMKENIKSHSVQSIASLDSEAQTM